MSTCDHIRIVNELCKNAMYNNDKKIVEECKFHLNNLGVDYDSFGEEEMKFIINMLTQYLIDNEKKVDKEALELDNLFYRKENM